MLKPGALMIGRSLRKLLALLFVLLGVRCVMTMVDATPWLGSPQLDYPALNVDQPFWPQLALLWAVIGLGGGLLTALGMLAWSDEPIGRPGWKRAGVVAAASFVLVAGFQLAGFAAYGTMGPLHVQQPIFRFALVNGAVSSAVITLAWSLASVVVGWMNARLSRPRAVLVSFVAMSVAVLGAILGIAVVTGLPLRSTLGWWWPGALILATAAALLTAIVPRSRSGPGEG